MQTGSDPSELIQEAATRARIALQTRGLAAGDALVPLTTGFRCAVEAGVLASVPPDLEAAHRAHLEGIAPNRQEVEGWLLDLEAAIPPPAWRGIASRLAAAALALGAVAVLAGSVAWFRTLPAEDDGLTATYYSEPQHRGHPFVRIDSTIAFQWGTDGPLSGVPGEDFSATWAGCLVVERPDMWLVTGVDENSSARVEVAGESLRVGGQHLAQLSLDALPRGVHPVEVSLNHRSGEARIYVGWRLGRNGPTYEIPPRALIPVGGNSRQSCPGDPPKVQF